LLMKFEDEQDKQIPTCFSSAECYIEILIRVAFTFFFEVNSWSSRQDLFDFYRGNMMFPLKLVDNISEPNDSCYFQNIVPYRMITNFEYISQ